MKIIGQKMVWGRPVPCFHDAVSPGDYLSEISPSDFVPLPRKPTYHKLREPWEKEYCRPTTLVQRTLKIQRRSKIPSDGKEGVVNAAILAKLAFRYRTCERMLVIFYLAEEPGAVEFAFYIVELVCVASKCGARISDTHCCSESMYSALTSNGIGWLLLNALWWLPLEDVVPSSHFPPPLYQAPK